MRCPLAELAAHAELAAELVGISLYASSLAAGGACAQHSCPQLPVCCHAGPVQHAPGLPGLYFPLFFCFKRWPRIWAAS